MKRRQFLKNSAFGAVAPVALGSQSSLASGIVNEEILIHIFLRGGIDGLNVVVPLDDKDHEYYSIMRPELRVPESGTGGALPIHGNPFGFNPIAAPLKDLFDAGQMAIIQAVGTPDDIASRSHFDAEKYIDLGTPGSVGTTTGWLHRHFLSMTGPLGLYPEEIQLPIVAFHNIPPVSLLGNNSSLTVHSPESFRIDNAHWRWNVDAEPWQGEGYKQLELLADIHHSASDSVTVAGHQALASEELLRTNYDPEYTSSGTIVYPQEDLGNLLSDLAQLIKLDAGTRLFTLDYGGWDTHADQNQANSFDYLLDSLCRALAAFFDDLNSSGDTYADRTTVIIQSEFGRRAFQNNSNGTDHGNGNIMLVLGKQVNGGKIYGDWPGLYPGTADEWVDYANPKNGSTEPELYEGALATTTDFRQVLSEYLQRRCWHNSNSLGFVFPNYSGYEPMGIFKTLTDDSDVIYRSSFES